MPIQKYKICPVCGEQNPPSLLECRNCETDLTAIKVTDPAEEMQKDGDGAAPAVSCGDQSSLVRICDCGQANPPQARKCIACGEDISDILPTPAGCTDQIESTAEEAAASGENGTAYRLEAIGEAFSAMITEPECIIGRTEMLKEYLGSRMYVSRRHAKLTVVGDQVFIENLSSTNRTFINNEPVSGPRALQDGDEIGLGGIETEHGRQEQAAYFYFRRNI